MKNNIEKVRKYEAKNPNYAGYMRLLSGARAFINPREGTKSYDRVNESDRYINDLIDLKKIIDKKLDDTQRGV